MPENKIRVLVVDDSAVMRGLLSEMINTADDLIVAGVAQDAATAREMVKTLNPDVMTLDINMPGMDGLEFLERLMRLRPMPVVMVSAHTRTGSESTLRALELGATDFIGKPRAEGARALEEYAEELREKIRAAQNARIRPLVGSLGSHAPQAKMVIDASSSARVDRVVFVGASTGGTEAIKDFLAGIPADCPPILIVQHMPETFTASFARRLDGLCAPRVIEAQGSERLQPGMVYVAPGHSHLRVRRHGASLLTELQATPPVNRHRPSVDVLFDSAASVLGRDAVGVILTGMGKDGAQGLLRMRKAGARTFGQDEGSSIVYGMPREAFLIGAVEEQYPLGMLAKKVMQVLGR